MALLPLLSRYLLDQLDDECPGPAGRPRRDESDPLALLQLDPPDHVVEVDEVGTQSVVALEPAVAAVAVPDLHDPHHFLRPGHGWRLPFRRPAPSSAASATRP